MSYILDALKRAKAERDRGAAPSIHMAAPPQLADEDEEDAPGGGAGASAGQPLRWVVAGLSVALLLSLGWQFLGGSEEAAPPRADRAGPPPGTAGQGDYRPPPPPQAMPPQPPRQAADLPPPAQVPPPLAPAPLPSATPRVAPFPPPAPAPVAAPPVTAAAPSPAASATPQELPDDLRRGLAVSGSRYSDNPSSRIVFINGQVFREGDQPSPGVTIERIGLKAVTLTARGQRYELKY